MVHKTCAAVLKSRWESVSLSAQFAHCPNDCATFDSTCRLCGLTVGRADREVALFQLELRHVCQPLERRQATRIAYRIFNPVHRIAEVPKPIDSSPASGIAVTCK